jgi:hypothetical protein
MKRMIALTLALMLFAAILPVHAQEGWTHTVTFDGFRFTYDGALGTQVHIRQVAGDPLDYEAPGGPQPPYTEFDVFTNGVGEANTTPWMFEAPLAVRVYRTADIAPYDYSQTQVDQLSALLADRPDLSVYTQPEGIAQQTLLPFLPIVNALQAIRAQAHYVDLPTLSGIAYVTTFRQSAYPFVSGEFLYTFQGLSADGQYYVSALFTLDAQMFPQDVPADFNFDAWMADLSTYYAESQSALETAAPGSFTPSLDMADAVFASFSFGS